MRRKSAASVCRAISAMAPAISTPVAPPPTMTKVSKRRCSACVGRELGLLEGDQNAAADAGRVLDALEARRDMRPIRRGRNRSAWRRSRSPDNRKATSPKLVCSSCSRGSTPVTSSISTVALRLVAQDVPDRPGHVGRRQRRGRHLIEQRLEAVMVLPVDHDRRRRARARSALAASRPPKPAPTITTLGRRSRHGVSFGQRDGSAKVPALPAPVAKSAATPLAIRAAIL